jgi:autotransporter-associated beta strand protein
LIKTGTGTLVLNGTNSYTGGTELASGTLRISADANLSDPSVSLIFSGGKLQWGAFFDLDTTRPIILNPGNGTIDTNGFVTVIWQAISGEGGLTKTGDGLLQLNGEYTYTGPTTVTGGTLAYGNQSLSQLRNSFAATSGGALQFNGTTVNLTSGTLIADTGGTILYDQAHIFGGSLSGSEGGAHFIGSFSSLHSTTIRLGAVVNQVGETNFFDVSNLGTLNSSATLYWSGGANANTLNINNTLNTFNYWFNAGTINIASNTNGKLINSGSPLVNTGRLNIGTAAAHGGLVSLGFTTLRNSGTITNNGTINGNVVNEPGGVVLGDGVINGTVSNSSIVNPGNSPGTLTINGGFAQSSDGELLIELAGPTSYDQLHVTGDATLNGNLTVRLLDGFIPTVGQSYPILTANAISGTFSSEVFPPVANLGFDVIFSAQTVALSVVPALPGDYNVDGAVNAADYVVWRKNPGGTYTQDDYSIWRANFGAMIRSGSSQFATLSLSPVIPEPTSLFLLLSLVAIAGCRHPRGFKRPQF